MFCEIFVCKTHCETSFSRKRKEIASAVATYCTWGFCSVICRPSIWMIYEIYYTCIFTRFCSSGLYWWFSSRVQITRQEQIDLQHFLILMNFLNESFLSLGCLQKYIFLSFVYILYKIIALECQRALLCLYPLRTESLYRHDLVRIVQCMSVLS